MNDPTVRAPPDGSWRYNHDHQNRRHFGSRRQLFLFKIPILFPVGIPSAVFSAIPANLLFQILPPWIFGVQERENINLGSVRLQGIGTSTCK